MRKISGVVLCILLISLCAFALADVEINETSFPDEAFREYVKQFDTDGDGSFSEEELANVEAINVSQKEISALQGVEYFTALKELRCEYNQLTSLDVSQNTALKKLRCFGNSLTVLDVSKNTALEILCCDSNQLTSLDVSKNTALKSLLCYNNQLTALDVSKNTALVSLSCDGNQLTALDVSKNTALVSLSCDGNQLTSLDISKNPALWSLFCSENQLTSLDVSKNPSLTQMGCYSNRLTSLKLGKAKALAILECYYNQLTSLDIRQCPELLKFVKGVEPTFYILWDIPYYGWYSDPEDINSNHLFIDEGVKVITDDEIPVTKIKLNKTKATLTRTSSNKKPTLQLKATVTPEDATDPTVEWKSSDPKIAKVDKNGKVTALKAGKVTITCTAKDGSGKKATCKITVKDQPVTKLTLNRKTLSLKRGKTFQLKVTISPAGAVNKSVKWTSSDKNVAAVDKNGKVKAVGKGTCVITCAALDGSGKTVTCKITVK